EKTPAMEWLFARHLRPFVLLAGAASLALNLALLAPALYMVQVFDRVFASRSVETLAMLSLAALLALVLGYCMDTVRAGALAWAGAALERRLSPAALAAALRQAASAPGRVDTDALRDIGKLRAFLGGSGIQALFDAPWLPLYLVVIAFMHPLLGATATLGAALIAGIAVLTERLTRHAAAQAVQQSRDASRPVEALSRYADALVGTSMTQPALTAWRGRHDERLAGRTGLGAASVRLAAAARIMRQGLQLAMLAVGAWLVIGADASPGIMIAATILLGRALQPLEQLVGGWKALLDARGAWRRLGERASIGPVESGLELPAPTGRLELEAVVFGPPPMRPALIKGIGFTLAPGESLGLVGPSASGKTTLLRLILGLWKPQTGCVRLDGADISLWERGALGKHVGYLPQDVALLG